MAKLNNVNDLKTTKIMKNMLERMMNRMEAKHLYRTGYITKLEFDNILKENTRYPTIKVNVILDSVSISEA
tara:strand:+ start:6973 stop:7185 length:213 start_codon:yes stop_codon:yes gene_type:complete